VEGLKGMTEMRGIAFANHVVQSLMGRTLIERGYILTTSSEEVEKDFGEGHVAWFDCGKVTISLPPKSEEGPGLDDKDTFDRDERGIGSIYQSRFSDSWALDSTYGVGLLGRTPSTAGLASIKLLDDPEFVQQVLKEAQLHGAR